MSSQNKKIVSLKQIEVLVEFLENHRDLAVGRLRSKEARALSHRLWSECAALLNSEADGISRTPKEWQKWYTDYKCRILARQRQIEENITATGAGAGVPVVPLGAMEERLCSLMKGSSQVLEREGTPPEQVRINPNVPLGGAAIMASDEQFSLCWNNFHANMSAGFHGLLSRGDLVDVTLAAEGRLLQAHKLVLSVCSPYFQEMFKMNPTQHPIVFLKDVSHSALRDLLQFMYQGEVNVKREELASFISTAEQLQVKGLTGNQYEESSTPSKPKPTSRPGPRSSQQRQSVMTKLETDLDTKPSSTPVAIKRPNRPSIASNNSSSSQSGPVKRKCVDLLEAGPSVSVKEEFVTIPYEDENNAVAPKMEPKFVNESMWDDDEEGANNDDTNFGEDDSNMKMSGFDGSATGDGNISAGGEGGL